MADERTEGLQGSDEQGAPGPASPSDQVRRPVLKKRRSRKERHEDLEQPDEFMEVGGTIIDTLLENGRTVGMLLAGVLLVLLVWGSANFFSSSKAKDASAALFAARELLPSASLSLGQLNVGVGDDEADKAKEAAKLDKAVAVLDGVIASYGNSAHGHYARMAAGAALYRAGEVERALGYFEGAAGAGKLVGSRALNAKAHALSDLGRYDEAIAAFDDLRSQVSGQSREQAVLDLARTYQAAGKGSEATALYLRFETDFPDSARLTDVKAKIAASAAQ